jgi:hypothetical protein
VLADIIVVLGEIVGGTACRANRGNRQHRSEPHIHVVTEVGRRVAIHLGRAVAVPFSRVGEGLASAFLDGDLLFAALG